LTARYYILPDDGHTEKNKNKVEYRLLVKHDCKEYEVYTVSNDEFFEKAIRCKKGDFIPGTSIQFETNNFVLDISEMDIL
jgi:hypothetical protein